MNTGRVNLTRRTSSRPLVIDPAAPSRYRAAMLRARPHAPRSLCTACLLALAACAPDEIIPAELDEVCDAPSPFRLLELDPDRTISFAGQIAQVEDRRVLFVRYLDEEEHESFPQWDRSEIWSVGECGEDPKLLATDVDTRWSFEVWPDLLLGCRSDAGEIVTIDPLGVRPSNVVFRAPGCGVDETPWGLVAFVPNDEQTSSVVLLRYPDDPWTQTATSTILIDAVRRAPDPPDSTPSNYWSTAVFDDELFAITPADELIHFSLLDGTVTIEATGVRSFQVSPDLRWIVWQDTTVTGTNGTGWQEGKIFLLDRSTGTSTHLVDTSLSFSFSLFEFVDDGFIHLYLGGFGTKPQRFFSTSSATTFDVQPGHRIDARLEDGRWLDSGFFGYGPFSVFDPETRTAQSLFEHEGRLWADGDRFLVLQASAHALLNDSFGVEGRLWSLASNGSRELLAERVTEFYRFLDDGRPLAVLDVDSRWLGNLIVVEPDSLEERRVDAKVSVGAWVLDDGETMLYGVSDRDRTGVWLARLAPSE